MAKAHGWIGFNSSALPGITSGSAYAANDAVGSAFVIKLVGGARGGVQYNGTMIERGISRPSLRMHLFATGFSGSVNGVGWALADVDDEYYLGYIDVSSWVSAGAGKSVADVKNPEKLVFSVNGARDVHGQLQTLTIFTAASAGTTPYRWNIQTIMD